MASFASKAMRGAAKCPLQMRQAITSFSCEPVAATASYFKLVALAGTVKKTCLNGDKNAKILNQG